MNARQRICRMCGLPVINYVGLGSGRKPSCTCPRPAAKRETSRREPTQNITYVAPTPTIADQLVVLAKLRKEGALTEQEFQTLKTRLISSDES